MGGCSNHPIRDFFRDLFCSDSCCVGHSSGPSESEKHAREIANELAEMKEKTGEISSRTEKRIMDTISASMDGFLNDVDKWNKQTFFGETLNINTTSIREKNEALKNQVVGSISKVMNTRLVQTDKEVSTILAERNKKKRKENFEAFVERLKRQAISNLKKEIEKSVNAQSDVVSNEIKTRQKEVNSRMEESVRELTEIMEVKNKTNSELERKQIDYMYQSSLCDILLAEVEG